MNDDNKGEKKGGLYNRWNFEVARFAGTEEPGYGYMLQAVLVEPDATVATDGVVLVRVEATGTDNIKNFPRVPPYEPVRVEKPFLFPVDAARKIAKAIPKKATIPVLKTAAFVKEESGGHGFVTTDLDTTTPVVVRKEERGMFPVYAKEFPNEADKTFEVKLDGQRLAKIVKFLADFDGRAKEEQPVTITFYKGSRGHIVRFDATNQETGQKASAILATMGD